MFLELFQIINFNIQYLQSISSAPYPSISLLVFKGYLSCLRGCESGRHENLQKKQNKTKQNKTNKQTETKRKNGHIYLSLIQKCKTRDL